MKIKFRFENILLLFVIICGVSISILQFFYNRSLWFDESTLSLNILNRNFTELLQPLDFEQVAPILFLSIEKIFTFLFGYSEYALRLFPLLSYWASIYLLYKIFKIFHLNTYVIILSLTLFLFNGTIIYYSSEVKQYMTDVLTITSMIYFTLKNYEKTTNKYVLLGFLGIVSIFLSNVSPIILLCCGAYLFYNMFLNGWNEIKYFIATIFIWILFFGIYFLFFIYDHPTREFMLKYWIDWDGFMPLNPLQIDFYQYIIRKYYHFYNGLFQFGIIGFYGLQLLFLFGCYILIERKKYNIFILSILPIVVHLALSSLKLYPFDIRLILYTCPAFIITLSFGFEYVISSVKNPLHIIYRVFLILLLLFFPLSAYMKIPIKRSEVKDCLIYLKQNINNEKIYFSYYTISPLKYYTETSLVDFSNYNTHYGKLDNYENLLKDINSLKGRVWFVFSDFIEYNFRRVVIEEFNDRKHHLIKQYNVSGASVYLYEIDE